MSAVTWPATRWVASRMRAHAGARLRSHRCNRSEQPRRGGDIDAKLGVSDVAAVCDVCNKGPGFGNKVSHSMRHSRRRWNPNIQTVHAKVGVSQRKRLNVCTSCIKAGKVTRG